MARGARPALAAVAAAAALGMPGAAAASLELTSLGSTPEAISFPRPGTVTYRFAVATGTQDEVFSLRYRTPSFGPLGFHPLLAGSSLIPAGPLRLDGPARLLGPASAGWGVIVCAPLVPAHGADDHFAAFDVLAPANTVTTVERDFVVVPDAPWPSTSYDVRFVADPELEDRRRGTLSRRHAVTVRGPEVRGRRGVELRLRSRPGTRPGRSGHVPVRRGTTVRLSGSTAPRRPHRRIAVWAARAGDPRFRFVKAVRTDRRGRFRTRMRIRGDTQVMVRIAAERPRWAADRSCPLTFDVPPPIGRG